MTRQVPLSRRAIAAYDRLPPRLDVPLVFPSPRGELLNQSNFRRREWAPAVTASGVAKPARIYDLRSTFASNALAAGVTVFGVARVMGTSVAMVERHYGALLDGAHAGIAGRLDALEAELGRAAKEAVSIGAAGKHGRKTRCIPDSGGAPIWHAKGLGHNPGCRFARKEARMDTVIASRISLRGQIGHFVFHYFEMCLPMCIGFAVGDLVYFWAAGLFGYSEPFQSAARAVGARRDIHHNRDHGGLDLEHGLMMPVMLIPMFFRLDFYTGRTGHTTQTGHTPGAGARLGHL